MRKKWEYLQIDVPPTRSVSKFLNTLGEDGWELVCLLENEKNETTLTLKREKLSV